MLKEGEPLLQWLVGGNLSGKKTSNRPKTSILVLGIGNILMGDEGVGVHVLRYLQEISLPDSVSLLDGGTGNFLLLEPMQSVDKVIIIDATVDGQRTGTVCLLRPKFTTEYPKTLTAHDIGLKDLLDAFHLLGDQPDVSLFAISIEKPNELNTEMSKSMELKVPDIAQLVVDQVLIQLK
jgi:hydrogenase maturation protease